MRVKGGWPTLFQVSSSTSSPSLLSSPSSSSLSSLQPVLLFPPRLGCGFFRFFASLPRAEPVPADVVFGVFLRVKEEEGYLLDIAARRCAGGLQLLAPVTRIRGQLMGVAEAEVAERMVSVTDLHSMTQRCASHQCNRETEGQRPSQPVFCQSLSRSAKSAVMNTKLARVGLRAH